MWELKRVRRRWISYSICLKSDRDSKYMLINELRDTAEMCFFCRAIAIWLLLRERLWKKETHRQMFPLCDEWLRGPSLLLSITAVGQSESTIDHLCCKITYCVWLRQTTEMRSIFIFIFFCRIEDPNFVGRQSCKPGGPGLGCCHGNAFDRRPSSPLRRAAGKQRKARAGSVL